MTAHAERSAGLHVTYQPGSVRVDIRNDSGCAVAEVYVSSAEGEAASLELAHQMAATPLLVEALETMLTVEDARCCNLYDEGHTEDCPFTVARAALTAARVPDEREVVGDE